MKFTRTGVAVLVGTGFLAGIAAGPGGRTLAGAVRIPQAAAQGTDTSDRLMSLFGDVMGLVRADYVEPVQPQTLIDNALNGMLTGLDPHSAYMTEQQWRDMQAETAGQFGGVGLEVTDNDGLLQVVSPIDDTPAARAGLQAGDLIVAVNGKSVEGLSLHDAVAEMRGPPATTLSLTVKRQGQTAPLTFTLTRQIIHVQTVKSRLLGDVGVIRITEFTEQANPGLRAALRKLRAQANGGLRGIVLDLRNDPGGLLDQAIAVANDFLDHGDIVSTRGRRARDDQNWSAEADQDVSRRLPVVVLINNGTASASEIVAGALQDNRRALVLGTQSFGKGSVQTLIPLDGNGAVRLTTARYYTPSGRSIQGLGITPNVEVHATRKPEPHFGPEHEADLLHVLANQGGDKPAVPPLPVAMPVAAQQIPHLPPADWPAFNVDKPATDFQLQQALLLVRAMATGPQAASR